MDARAAAAEATRERIAAAAQRAFTTEWYDDVTIRGIAGDAGVSLQTVLNHFPTKDDLCHVACERFTASIDSQRWAVAPGDVDGAVTVLVDDYDTSGEATLRMLAVEERVPALRPWLDLGRREHQRWVAAIFADAVTALPSDARDRRIAQLVVVTDVYAWKLLRRDRAMSRDTTITTIRELVLALY